MEVCDFFVLEYDCVRLSLRIVLLDSSDVYPVVVWGVLEVPSVDGMIVPGSACVGFLIYEYGASYRAKGHSVVVEESKHFRIGRYGGCFI